MKRKQLSLVLAAAFSGLCLSQYASADTATGTNPAAKTANPYAAHYGYPETRTSQDEIDRFETGEYGECEECGCNIPFERLKVEPMTQHCVQCKSRWEQKQRAARA